MEPLTRPAVLVTDRKYGRGDLSGADRGQSRRNADGSRPTVLLSWETVFAIFLVFVTERLNETTEGRAGLRWLTVSGGFQSVTAGKVPQNRWLVAGGHGGFLTLWFRQEAEDADEPGVRGPSRD